MPNRVIKESIKRSPQIDSLTWFEEVVFYRMIVTADDHGCLDGRIILLKNELFPTKENITKKAIEDAVSKLVSVGLLCKYTVNGMPYLFFPTWEKHQRIRNKRRKFPEPPNDTMLTADCGQVSADCPPESESKSESESNPKDSCAEPGEVASAQPDSVQSPEPVITLPLNTGEEYPILPEHVQEWAGLYPAVDVIQQLRAMRGWLIANKQRRKTKAGIQRFIVNWLKKEQDSGKIQVKSRGSGPDKPKTGDLARMQRIYAQLQGEKGDTP